MLHLQRDTDELAVFCEEVQREVNAWIQCDKHPFLEFLCASPCLLVHTQDMVWRQQETICLSFKDSEFKLPIRLVRGTYTLVNLDLKEDSKGLFQCVHCNPTNNQGSRMIHRHDVLFVGITTGDLIRFFVQNLLGDGEDEDSGDDDDDSEEEQEYSDSQLNLWYKIAREVHRSWNWEKYALDPTILPGMGFCDFKSQRLKFLSDVGPEKDEKFTVESLCSQVWYIHPCDLLDLMTTDRDESLKVNVFHVERLLRRIADPTISTMLLQRLEKFVLLSLSADAELSFGGQPQSIFHILDMLMSAENHQVLAKRVYNAWKRFQDAEGESEVFERLDDVPHAYSPRNVARIRLRYFYPQRDMMKLLSILHNWIKIKKEHEKHPNRRLSEASVRRLLKEKDKSDKSQVDNHSHTCDANEKENSPYEEEDDDEEEEEETAKEEEEKQEEKKTEEIKSVMIPDMNSLVEFPPLEDPTFEKIETTDVVEAGFIFQKPISSCVIS